MTELSENEGRVAAKSAGDVLEVMMQSGMRMGSSAQDSEGRATMVATLTAAAQRLRLVKDDVVKVFSLEYLS